MRFRDGKAWWEVVLEEKESNHLINSNSSGAGDTTTWEEYFLHRYFADWFWFQGFVGWWIDPICDKLGEGTQGNFNQNHHSDGKLQPTLQLSGGGRTYSS